MQETLRQFSAEATAMADWVTAHRRALHQIPELSGQERETQAYILRALTGLGIPCQTYPDLCAVVGIIEGAHPGPTVALRADMDALPIDEPEGAPHRSCHPGVMHACGHDAHMAIQLGAAKLLMACRGEMHGNIKLFFEHAEETTGGAREMIAAGCMASPRVDAILGLHMCPQLPAGVFRTRAGAVSGSSDDVHITLTGRTGHGAYPERSIDAIVIAAQVIAALQTVVSRNLSPFDAAALSIGVIQGGTLSNVVCDKVTLQGTLRTLTPEARDLAKRRITEIVAHTAAAMGGEGAAELTGSYGAVVNDPALTEAALAVATEALGADRIAPPIAPSLGVESFNFFVQDTPGVYYDMGCGVGAPLHAKDFCVDEACLPVAVLTQCAVAWAFLSQLKEQ